MALGIFMTLLCTLGVGASVSLIRGDIDEWRVMGYTVLAIFLVMIAGVWIGVYASYQPKEYEVIAVTDRIEVYNSKHGAVETGYVEVVIVMDDNLYAIELPPSKANKYKVGDEGTISFHELTSGTIDWERLEK